ncbi:MAG: hypothetical protein DDT30_01659 [Dehalococcoidia bacterium]|nr:hypothetical protein [Bacillota bacterium]MBT9159788.1 hypothetical protein [Chloroflexota bacterium]MBT9162665.1 hypothetical protein [Chloroflexota bacterium]MBT9163699.1 hypothetical protein [Chloroflexota bacterium]
MRKDREFNNILEECLERLLRNDETVEQCLQRHPEQSSELEPLLKTALDVRKASAVQPSAEFKARARYQFHLALAELKPKRRPWGWEWRPRWLTAAAIILVVLLAGSGMGIAAYHSMPGELLHPVRLTAEEIWLARTPPGIARAKIHAELAARRVAEIVYLTEGEDRSAKIEQVAQRLYYHLATIESLAAAEMVMAMTHVVEEVTPLSTLDAAVPEALAGEEDIGEIGPAGPQGLAGLPGVITLTGVGAQDARWIEFRATLKQQEAAHLADLHNLLPVVPESARAALLTAIAVAEAGYERAIEALERDREP